MLAAMELVGYTIFRTFAPVYRSGRPLSNRLPIGYRWAGALRKEGGKEKNNNQRLPRRHCSRTDLIFIFPSLSHY